MYGFMQISIFFSINIFRHSSAHYYLRLKKGETIDDIPENILEEIAQMTKESSKDGKKVDNVRIVYTMAENLKKTNDMEIGEVSYKNRLLVKGTMVKEKKKDILNRLIKTRLEKQVDLKRELEDRLNKEKNMKKREEKLKKEEKLKELEEKKKDQDLKNYSSLMKPENMKKSSNVFDDEDEEDSKFIGRNDPTLDAFF